MSAPRYRGLWVSLVFTLVGMTFVLTGISFGIQSVSLWAGTTATEGTVTASEARHSPGNSDGPRHARSRPTTNYVPVVRYVVDGQFYFTTGIVASSGEPYPLGQKLPVLYRTARPSVGYVNTFAERWLLPVVFTIIGALFAVIGIIYLLIMRILSDRTSRLPRRGA